jgi:hypothetical protein
MFRRRIWPTFTARRISLSATGPGVDSKSAIASSALVRDGNAEPMK